MSAREQYEEWRKKNSSPPSSYTMHDVYMDFTEAYARSQNAELRAALAECVDSLEYVQRAHPEATGWGVRAVRINQAKVLLGAAALAEGEGADG